MPEQLLRNMSNKNYLKSIHLNFTFKLVLMFVFIGLTSFNSFAKQNDSIEVNTSTTPIYKPVPVSEVPYDSSLFGEVEVNPEYGSTTVSWEMGFDDIVSLKENGYQGVVYFSNLASIVTSEDGVEDITWSHADYFDISKSKYELKGLTQGESYKIKLGVVKTGQVINPRFKQEDEIWSGNQEFSIDGLFGIFDLLKLIGALCFFIYGMKVMSEGIQKLAGNSMRKILGSLTKNRVFGAITGF
ncbi:MAG: hypothetical protein ACI9J3_002255, partial [Parvicellaceae bacterium]